MLLTCVWVAIAFVILGNFIFLIILIQRRFHKAKSYLEQNAEKSNISSLDQIIKKVNGWLYLLMFFNCIQYSFGPWSIVFSLLCFFSSTQNNEMIAFCSIFATISSSILLFSSPSSRYTIANKAWKEAAPLLESFIVSIPEYKDKATLRAELRQLGEKVANTIS